VPTVPPVVPPRQWSAKHKAYAAALGVALVALAYDQSRPAGPRSARAAAIPPVEAIARAASGAGPIPTIDAPDNAGVTTVARRLRAVAGGADPLTDLRDAFAPSAAWAADCRPAVDGAASDEAFAADHKLSVVLFSAGGAGGSAVIAGRLVHVGQSIDGYCLTAVTPRTARLRGPDGDVELGMR
jgi:hypothetical protein